MGRKRFTKAERERVYQKCGGRCAYCGCPITFEEMQADHMVPLRKGGSDTLDNLLPACRSCNHYKHTLTVEEFRAYVSGIPERLERDSIPYQVGVRFGLIHSDTKVEFYYEKNKNDDTP